MILSRKLRKTIDYVYTARLFTADVVIGETVCCAVTLFVTVQPDKVRKPGIEKL